MFDESYESAGDYEFWLRIAGKDNFFYINEPLGLYLAREDGKELADPKLSITEGLAAWIQHTSKGIAADLLMKDLVKLNVGESYITTTPEGIYGMAEFVKQKVEEFDYLPEVNDEV